MQSFVLVALGGAIGSMLRYAASLLVGRVWTGPFPLATLLVNVAGSLAMGLLIGLLARFAPAWHAEARLFAAVGVLGGFTTFSAFSLDAVGLLERGQFGPALVYVALSVALCLLALYLGLMITRTGAS